MGLTRGSVGAKAERTQDVKRKTKTDKIIALAGNPNVGKSTVFNALTGMHQHTGNWAGKTVGNAEGYFRSERHGYVMVDIPGTYSLMPHSAEEEVARDFICFGDSDIVMVVCDATCLCRNLNLVLQITEVTSSVILCVNLMDEAKRKHILVDIKELKKRLGIPVIDICAREKNARETIIKVLDDYTPPSQAYQTSYPPAVEEAVAHLEAVLAPHLSDKIRARWLALRLLDEHDDDLLQKITHYLKSDIFCNEQITEAIQKAKESLQTSGITEENYKDIIVSCLNSGAEQLCDGVVTKENDNYIKAERKIDRILTGRISAFPIMCLLLLAVLWLTISGANYPSALLSSLFGKGEVWLSAWFARIGAPLWLNGILIQGAYRVLTWVVAVMLPPMAIFFPLFTLLEDVGYLPRVAYNLDKPFAACQACGKQSLTMCMGLGCNAAGVVGCRIIDSPRERLLAILTNNFIPCNGRFPTLIALISMFFVGSGMFTSFYAVFILGAVIIGGIGMTFLVTKLLSATLLKGKPSSFTLEMPPFRKPQIIKVLIRSVFDRTLFVLGRAMAVAAPAGVLIWLCANITIYDGSILSHMASFFDPFGRFMGLDGMIIIAFILGFPANEIVLPIMLMGYMANGSLFDIGETGVIKSILLQNGWTQTTALNMMVFSLFHFPCSTTLLTIKKETGSLKWTAVSAVLPTVIGIMLCIIINLFSKFIG